MTVDPNSISDRHKTVGRDELKTADQESLENTADVSSEIEALIE